MIPQTRFLLHSQRRSSSEMSNQIIHCNILPMKVTSSFQKNAFNSSWNRNTLMNLKPRNWNGHRYIRESRDVDCKWIQEGTPEKYCYLFICESGTTIAVYPLWAYFRLIHQKFDTLWIIASPVRIMLYSCCAVSPYLLLPFTLVWYLNLSIIANIV